AMACRSRGGYLLLEALNLRLVGPQLALLETADCSDGLLEVVYLRPDQREAFCEWLDCGMAESLTALPSLRCRHIELTFERGPLRLGDNISWPSDGKISARHSHKVNLRAAGRWVNVLAPSL